MAQPLPEANVPPEEQKKDVFEQLEFFQLREAKLKQSLKQDTEQIASQSNQVTAWATIVEERMQVRKGKLEEYMQYHRKIEDEKEKINTSLKEKDDPQQRAKLQQLTEHGVQLAAKCEELHRMQDDDQMKLGKYAQKQMSLKKTEAQYAQLRQKHAEAEADVKRCEREVIEEAKKQKQQALQNKEQILHQEHLQQQAYLQQQQGMQPMQFVHPQMHLQMSQPQMPQQPFLQPQLHPQLAQQQFAQPQLQSQFLQPQLHPQHMQQWQQQQYQMAEQVRFQENLAQQAMYQDEVLKQQQAFHQEEVLQQEMVEQAKYQEEMKQQEKMAEQALHEERMAEEKRALEVEEAEKKQAQEEAEKHRKQEQEEAAERDAELRAHLEKQMTEHQEQYQQIQALLTSMAASKREITKTEEEMEGADGTKKPRYMAPTPKPFAVGRVESGRFLNAPAPPGLRQSLVPGAPPAAVSLPKAAAPGAYTPPTGVRVPPKQLGRII